MRKSYKIMLSAVLIVFIAIQLIPSGIPSNKPEDEKSIVNNNLAPVPVLEQLRKSCFDCHSNRVQLPWYSKLAPSSWLLSGHINEGKSNLNFSEWEDYGKREKIRLLEEIMDEVRSGNMPLKSYLLVHRDAKLSSEKISLLLKWSEEATAKILE